MKKITVLPIIALFFLGSPASKAALNSDNNLQIPHELQQFFEIQQTTELGRYFIMRIKKAREGDALSQLIVGGIFLASRKIPNHLEQAYMWSFLAKRGGIPEASNLLKFEIIPRMTAEQIDKAKQMATDCLISNYKECWKD